MALREILFANNPILRQKSKKVRTVDPSVQRLIDDMIETMHAGAGVGLAAPQVGVLQRVIVIHIPEPEEEAHRSHQSRSGQTLGSALRGRGVSQHPRLAR